MGLLPEMASVKNPRTKILLSLYKFIECSKNIAGENHHFKAIQLPYNLVMLEAIKQKNQRIEDSEWTILDAAKKLNIGVIVSAPLMQSRIKLVDSVETADSKQKGSEEELFFTWDDGNYKF